MSSEPDTHFGFRRGQVDSPLSTIDVGTLNYLQDVAEHPAKRASNPWNKVIAGVVLLVVGACVVVVINFVTTYNRGSNFGPTPTIVQSQYPVGVVNLRQPSGVAPTASDALKGYSLSYASDFTGNVLPKGWNVFFGVPGGDPGGQFGLKHVVVSNGMLQLNTWRDPLYKNHWVTGGLCQCGRPMTFGAYFVRSRVTGGGPNAVELLWPLTNKWPPEIDFNETAGSITSSSSTIHWSPINQIEQRHLTIDMKRWHTWGVIWTRSAVTYVVDGQVWGKIANVDAVPKIPMTLDFEQIALCGLHSECPTHPVSMQIDWVTEYQYK